MDKVFKRLLLVILVCTFVACGQPLVEITIEKITPVDTIFTYDTLTPVGFKKAKKFKVEGLTKANSAYYGFFKEDPEVDYEVRFYDSHQDAVEFGTSFAEERTGEDAVLKKDKATWKEGVKEARSCAGNPHGSNVGAKGGQLVAHDIQSCMYVKYADYVIYGNMILLCAGWDSEGSIRNCQTLIHKLTTPSAE